MLSAEASPNVRPLQPHVGPRRKLASPRRPPGPPGHFLIGHLTQAIRDPLAMCVDGFRDYGDIVHFYYGNSVVGEVTYYLVSDPDMAQHVMQRNTKNYTKSRNYAGLKLVLGNGLLTSEGDFWKRQRRLSQPAFHHARLRGFAESMVDCTRVALDRLASRDDARAPLDVHELMMRLTFRIVGKTLFSTDVENEAREVGDALNVALHFANRYVTSVLKLPTWVPTPNNARFNKALSTLDRLVYRIIEERRQLMEDRPDAVPGDLLTMLMEARGDTDDDRMNDRQLRDEVMTLVLAGHETTANALSWTLYLLSRHPDIARRLEAEIDEVLGGREPTLEDLPRLTLTDRVLNESLRLYPPAWNYEREAIEPDVVGGFDLPRGGIVAICPYTLHRHPKLWDNPEGFDPDRFSPERSEGRHRFAFIPFADGPRVCIGKSFAMMEAKIILAMFVARYRASLVPGFRAIEDASITLRPKTGILAEVSERLPSSPV